MDTYLKRYIWVLHLALIAAVAHSASLLVSHFILDAASSVLSPSAQANAQPMKRSKLETKRTQKWATKISNRNLFNANPPGPEELSSKEPSVKEEEKPKGQLPMPYDECEDSDLKVTVQVTMVAEPPSASYSMINVEGEDRIYRIGDLISDREIVAIQWSGNGQRVVISNSGKFECLTLGKKNATGGRKRFTPPKSANTKPTENNNNNNDKFKDGVKEVSPGRFEVDRAMLDEQLADLDNLVRQARVIPHYKRGKPAGFKVVGIRSNSIFRHLGLKSGDVLKSVGGEELTSINKALGLFEKLKTSDNVNLDLERRGKVSSFEYNIK